MVEPEWTHPLFRREATASGLTHFGIHICCHFQSALQFERVCQRHATPRTLGRTGRRPALSPVEIGQRLIALTVAIPPQAEQQLVLAAVHGGQLQSYGTLKSRTKRPLLLQCRREEVSASTRSPILLLKGPNSQLLLECARKRVNVQQLRALVVGSTALDDLRKCTERAVSAVTPDMLNQCPASPLDLTGLRASGFHSIAWVNGEDRTQR
ncbi:hypothetical protein MHYP_G00212640 [Metynnis hypsauchen]